MIKSILHVTRFLLPLIAVAVFLYSTTNSQELNFSLHGSAGGGLTSDNEPGDVTDGGSGDMGPGGIVVNLSTRILSMDVEWGSGNGYEDLSSDVDFMNIHGPTATQSPDSYFENGKVLTGLSPFDPSASSGGFQGEVQLSSGELTDLIEGRFYIHLHTFVNPNGEARGYMIPDVRVGDVNGDGLINLLDVQAFIDAVQGPIFVDEADINRDGVLDLLDVAPFVDLLAGQ